MTAKNIITYTLVFDDQNSYEVPIHLEGKSLELFTSKPAILPEWTRLDYCQCPNCPLKLEETPHCPVAINLVELVSHFCDLISHQTVKVSVQSSSRTYTVETTVQDTLSSILGLYMSCSGCPILDKLRPMARFHLPFSSYEETSYRSLSMYLIAQYLRYKEGKSADWDLEGFVAMYKEIQIVNQAFSQRLCNISQGDANNNALVILDCFASLIAMDTEVETIVSDELKVILKPFL
ncbi:MAG: hypothetical protein GQ569_15150 [Methylococcaceae bacterium]|nr:hypothetical protein [Methylococcaceae bacterium]